MKFERQIQFSRTIKVNGQLKEFNFLKIKSAAVPTYHVDVSDERGNRLYFSLIYENTKWVIGKTSLPGWITAAENEIAAAVSAHESV